MNNTPTDQNPERNPVNGKLVEATLQALRKEYVVVGKTHIKAWHAWLVLGLVAGVATGVILVANRSGEVEQGRAMELGETYQLPLTPPLQAKDSPESKRVSELSASALNLLSQVGKTGVSSPVAATAELEKVLRDRKQALEALIEKDPTTALFSFFPRSVISKVPKAMQSLVEQLVTIEATIEVFHRDDFQNRVATYEYFLKRGTTRLQFFPVGNLPSMRSGATVRIDGFQLGSELVVAPVADNTFQILAAPPPPDSIGDQKTLAILIDFLESPQPPPFSAAQGPALIFQGPMQAFYKEASYNQISWSGDVVGWYTVPRNGVDANGNPTWPSYGYDLYDPDGVYAYIKSQNIDLTQYQRLILLAHHPAMYGGHAFVGKIDLIINGKNHSLSIVSVGSLDKYSQPSWWGAQPFTWTNLDYILTHELGHGLGLLHANSWECGQRRVVYGEQCTHLEYGNWYDAMGSGYRTLHFNAYFKDLLGWASQALTISQSGNYTLQVFETPSNAVLAKIYHPALNVAPYYLEYRRAVGFDANLADPAIVANQEGLFVNWALLAPWLPVPVPFSRLLDITPASSISNDWDDVVLQKAGRLLDIANGILIGPVLRQGPSGITFAVRFLPPKCIRTGPAVTVSTPPPPVAVSPGSVNVFNIMIENRDSLACGTSDFFSSVVTPPNWSSAYTSQNPVSITPFRGSGWISGEIQVSPTAPAGVQYTVRFTVTNVASGRSVTIPIEYIVQ